MMNCIMLQSIKTIHFKHQELGRWFNYVFLGTTIGWKIRKNTSKSCVLRKNGEKNVHQEFVNEFIIRQNRL